MYNKLKCKMRLIQLNRTIVLCNQLTHKVQIKSAMKPLRVE